MGACKYSNAWKNCATCDHWQGERKVNPEKDSVVVDSSAKGICNGFWKGSRKFGNNNCTEWGKWAQLVDQRPEPNTYP